MDQGLGQDQNQAAVLNTGKVFKPPWMYFVLIKFII